MASLMVPTPTGWIMNSWMSIGIVGMLAAIDDVHHRHRQGAGIDAADIAVERQTEIRRGGLGDGERDAEDGVGA